MYLIKEMTIHTNQISLFTIVLTAEGINFSLQCRKMEFHTQGQNWIETQIVESILSSIR